MAKLVLHLAKSESSGGADEDWWDLVFDADRGEIYVKHSWSHLDRRGTHDLGSEQIELSAILQKEPRSKVRTSLVRALQTMFLGGTNA